MCYKKYKKRTRTVQIIVYFAVILNARIALNI